MIATAPAPALERDRARPLRVTLLAKPAGGTTGTSRYTAELARGHALARITTAYGEPLGPPLPAGLGRRLRGAGLDLDRFFYEYPVRARLPRADIYHLTSQTLATLLALRRLPRPTVVTVLDIIPYLVRQDRRLSTYRHPVHRCFDYLAMLGLKRADRLIAISHWTRATLTAQLGIRAERIDVVHLGADLTRYCPRAVPDAFRERYGLTPTERYVLFVGSEDPRKNLATLLRAFALVRREWSDVRLLKVGAAHHLAERGRLQRLAADLGIERQVRWIDHVPEADLPLFYNAAALCVMPSLYEGFGLPAVEAMACGTPVICSDAASLPEVVGEAAVVVPAHATDAFAQAMLCLLNDQAMADRLASRGLARAASLTWDRSVQSVAAVYERVLTSGGGSA